MSNGDAPLRTRPTNTTDGAADPYDHPIFLVDTTDPQPNPPRTSRSSSPNKLAKRTTETSVKGHLVKNRYTKWQHERYSSEARQDATQPRPPESQTGVSQDVVAENGDRLSETETTDFTPQPATPGRGRTCPPDKQKKPKHGHKTQPYEVDILYENQRGLFFFGIPLYSHSSLLNLDPAPWVTKELKDSAVNITNAQVPDPSWEWAWKSWYVDMSYDVDEEGWQYSFSFGRRWVWHGTHPWFHSYVRRRRWLRKRVKRDRAAVIGTDGSMLAAHVLTGDYFTIHPKRDRSPTSTLATTARASLPNQRAGLDDPPEDVDNVVNLLKALRLAAVDREKIDVVRKFLKQGGEELTYLEPQIPEIMSLFVFQTSRRQLVELLQHEAAGAQKHRDEHDAKGRPEGQAESARIDNILKAMRTANGQIGGLEYWSDRKHVLQFAGDDGIEKSAKRDLTTYDGASAAPTEDDPVQEVKGISQKAEIEFDVARSDVDPNSSGSNASKVEDKGKGKANETAEDEKGGGYKSFNTEESLGRIPSDTVLVPAKEE